MIPNAAPKPLDFGWDFDNSYIRLPKVFYAGLNPFPVRAPKLVAFNRSLALTLGLNDSALDSDEGAAVFAGNSIPEGAEPLAQGGHDFWIGHELGHVRIRHELHRLIQHGLFDLIEHRAPFLSRFGADTFCGCRSVSNSIS